MVSKSVEEGPVKVPKIKKEADFMKEERKTKFVTASICLAAFAVGFGGAKLIIDRLASSS